MSASHPAPAGTTGRGCLLIIGGHEDKTDGRLLLRAVASHARDGALVVCTAASEQPTEVWDDYLPLFRDLGVREVRHLHVDSRDDAMDDARTAVLDDACVVFFTGGDQLKLTSQLGATRLFERVRAVFDRGGLVAGTSAGASVVCETMLVSGEQSASPQVRDTLRMAAGFGFLRGALVDQHFAERGRIGRLIGAVAQNPAMLGIGLDEDTGLLVEGASLRVLGNGGVYIVDGAGISHSNLVEDASDRTLSVFGMQLHLLNMGDSYDLATRRPRAGSTEAAEAAVDGG